MNLPVSIIKKIEKESTGLNHGKIVFEIHIRDGNAARFIISREQSLLPLDINEA